MERNSEQPDYEEAETEFTGKFTVPRASIPKVFVAVPAVWTLDWSATGGAGQNRGPGDAIRDFVERVAQHREAA